MSQLSEQQPCYLQQAPPEIRNRIYREVCVSDQPIHLNDQEPSRVEPALLMACRAIRFEAIGIFYHANTFTAGSTATVGAFLNTLAVEAKILDREAAAERHVKNVAKQDRAREEKEAKEKMKENKKRKRNGEEEVTESTTPAQKKQKSLPTYLEAEKSLKRKRELNEPDFEFDEYGQPQTPAQREQKKQKLPASPNRLAYLSNLSIPSPNKPWKGPAPREIPRSLRENRRCLTSFARDFGRLGLKKDVLRIAMRVWNGVKNETVLATGTTVEEYEAVLGGPRRAGPVSIMRRKA
ncbi:unnamed protein product [Zymoseptoria tritici ST99CH_1A5]|uniref:Uncharacterized protein n=2 Tax=Zymoseptoria tritici TaxID=1047171 RepID=A0A1X7S2W4_ZYMT9|nr:unnamed protein product [Zymoseptoria tritici ST99CH_3D7]SMR61387.1 unnamed protein product [Zymoseptoria tritici ST99CH_3D1]SMY27606.1 unnamed protein product [Zymoseptoria tritici ST99CH_1A5]